MFKENIAILCSEIDKNPDSKTKQLYPILFILRRVIMITLFLSFQKLQLIVLVIYMLLSLMNLSYMSNTKPFLTKRTNRFEVFNEATVYIVTVFYLMFLREDITNEFMHWNGLLIVNLKVINMAINFLAICSIVLKNLYDKFQRRELKKDRLKLRSDHKDSLKKQIFLSILEESKQTEMIREIREIELKEFNEDWLP